jgi:SPP1 gp7 family putative phage head morphogenesis protein
MTPRLTDKMVLQNLRVQRFGNGLVLRMLSLMAAAERDLMRTISDTLMVNPGRDVATLRQTQNMIASLRQQWVAAFNRMAGLMDESLRDFGTFMADSTVSIIASEVRDASFVSAPSAEQIAAAAMSRPFAGMFMQEWIERTTASTFDKVQTALRMGFLEGKTTDEIVRQLRGTAGTPGILSEGRRQVEALVRTGVNAVANEARNLVYDANEDIIEGVRWVATLDDRTCPICQPLDGEVYPADSGPRPPAHVNCRCTTVPEIDWKSVGLDIDETSERASRDGPVDARLTYGEWLKRQDAETQDEVLGKARGRLFREGGLKLDRFINGKGEYYTLDTLRRKEKAAWKKAGLS